MHVDTYMKHLSLRVWLRIFVYAMASGLLIQLLVLPHIFPQLHAGNGLLAGRDWVGFHEQALAHAQQITLDGWGEFRLRPDGDNAIIGVTSFFYVILGPKPWALLPLSAAMFATGGLALFSMLKRLDLEDSEAGIALMPYLFFPSALLQYGQIHKDVFCTAGVLVILWAWVGLLRKERKLIEIFPLLAVTALALILVSVFRPYFMFPFLGLGAGLLAWHIVRIVWQVIKLQLSLKKDECWVALKFNFQSTAILALLCGFIYLMSISFLDIRMQPLGSSGLLLKVPVPVFAFKSNEAVRSADSVRIFYDEPLIADGKAGAAGAAGAARAAIRKAAAIKAAALEAAAIKAIQECRPILILRNDAFLENTINRVFLKIAVARAGFTSSGGTTAASNIDKGIDFCKNEDLIRYVPRAMQIAFFAPFPSKWLSTEKRNSSPVEIYISAVEMFYCYVAYLGLLYWLVSYKRWNVPLLIPISFALGLSLLLGLTVANVGTLYRMRFPFCMIFVSIGMAGLMQMAKGIPVWLERFNTASDS